MIIPLILWLKRGRGLICAPIDRSIAERLKLQSMEQNNTDIYGTHFTVSVDHYKTTTGISAHERTQTARALIDEKTNPEDFHRPGHLFPLIAKENGVLTRNGHTEAAVDLARLTGAQPAGVICEIMNDDGTMAKGEDLQSFKERHHLKMITIKVWLPFVRLLNLMLISRQRSRCQQILVILICMDLQRIIAKKKSLLLLKEI